MIKKEKDSPFIRPLNVLYLKKTNNKIKKQYKRKSNTRKRAKTRERTRERTRKRANLTEPISYYVRY